MVIKNVLKKEDGTASFELTVEEKEYEPYLEKASLQCQKKKPVPGYRVGKAPLKVAIPQYGQALCNAANQPALNDYFGKACVQEEMIPVSSPDFFVVENTIHGVTALCRFSVYPEVGDLDWKNVRPEKPVKTCRESEIDEEVDRYMDNHRHVHEVDREAQMGDIADVAFQASAGEEHPLLSHRDHCRFTLVSGMLFFGLDEYLVCHTAGDELDLILTMPEDFHREDVRGQTVRVHVRLNGVWERTRCECTDEFVKENVKGCDTVEEFREQLRAKIQKSYDAESDKCYERILTDTLAALVTCRIPEAMIRTSMNNFEGDLRSLAASRHLTPEQLLAEDNQTMEEFRAMIRPHAIRQVRFSLVLDAVIRSEGLSVTDQEVDERIRSMSARSGKPESEVEREQGGRDEIADKLLEKKARELIRRTVQPRPVEVEDFPKPDYEK